MCKQEVVAFGLNQMELDLTVMGVIVLLTICVGVVIVKYVNKGL
jgi:hypothetical protein